MIDIYDPCIGMCTTVGGGPICKGCFRTKEEVRDWESYTKDGKARVLIKCRDRKLMAESVGQTKH